MQNKLLSGLLALTLASTFAGCGKSREEATRDAERLKLEEQAERDVKKANKAITDMTDRAFRKRTPEEEEKAKTEKAKRVQELVDAQAKADADAKASPATQPKP